MRKAIVAILLLLPALAFGQSRNYVIHWTETDGRWLFPNAVYEDFSKALPKFALRVPWTLPGRLPDPVIEVQESMPVSPGQLTEEQAANLTSSPAVTWDLAREKGDPVVQISVTPFYINPATGKPGRIHSFSLRMESEKPIAALKSARKGTYAASSLLASGDWYKIAVSQSGIHQLTYAQLEEIGLENPASVKIFGNGAVLLPEDYSQGHCDDLQELPFYMDDGGDGLFGPGDRILFYARGPVSWSYDPENDFFEQELHPYATRGYYFLTDDRGVPGTTPAATLSTEAPDQTVTEYDIHTYLEEEKYNLLNSGREWYGDVFSLNLEAAYPFTLPGINSSKPVRIRLTGAARSNENSSFRVKANNTTLGSVPYNPVNLSSYTSTYAIEQSSIFDYNAAGEVITVSVEYLQPNTNSKAWLNHLTINGRAALSFGERELRFRDRESAGIGQVSEFRVTGIPPGAEIWDITDPAQPLRIPYNTSGGAAVFRLATDSLREFVAFDTEATFPAPEYAGEGVGEVENQDLHGGPAPDMIIVYNELFTDDAKRLAEHRESHDGLEVLTVTEEEIFNEFSSGTPHVAALRNYLKMYYDRGNPGDMPRYLLLFGDGSYDNRNQTEQNPNMILTYQSENSLAPTLSYVSDDFFGLLDTGERLYNGLLDIGIGRLPVSTVEEASAVVDKLIGYDQAETLGEWRNFICLIGDDEDGNIHMRLATSLGDYITENYPDYNINKIFLDAYPQVTTPTGDRYPDVTRAINDQVNRGALIMNYTGHGAANGLAHEKILDKSVINSWENSTRLPLFMTATCEFSRYDEYNHTKDAEVTSAGEEVILNPVGGGIALFTTTRLVYSGPNHILNEKFYEIVFEKDENGACYRLGDIIAYSKNNAGAGINKRNFTLLGDPATALAFPLNKVVTDSVNSMPVEALEDTIAALEYVTVSGHIENRSGEKITGFNGEVIPIVFDKEQNLQTLANDGGSPMEFRRRNSILYKGKASVTGGEFSFSFYTPKDISYVTGKGKISYYGDNDQTDAQGSTEQIVIGGISDQFVSDTSGPRIEVYMNDSLFRDGGITDDSPELLVYIRDNYGVNTTGNGIGHDITATLNEDRLNAIILNEYYQSDINSYGSGSVRYPYSDLETGRHTIDVKVWDIHNNSSTASIEFVVMESAEMMLEEVYNYPNPFIDETFFNVEHNRPDTEFRVEIRIYDINGRLATVLRQDLYSPGYRLDPVRWDGTGDGGATLGGGIYVYRVTVKGPEGEEAAGSGRLIIKR